MSEYGVLIYKLIRLVEAVLNAESWENIAFIGTFRLTKSIIYSFRSSTLSHIYITSE